MRSLLDTHAVFWAIMARRNLSPIARAAIEDDSNDVFVSVVNAWEIAIKVGPGKWPEASGLIANFEAEIATAGLELMAITADHVRAAGLMRTVTPARLRATQVTFRVWHAMCRHVQNLSGSYLEDRGSGWRGSRYEYGSVAVVDKADDPAMAERKQSGSQVSLGLAHLTRTVHPSFCPSKNKRRLAWRTAFPRQSPPH